MVQVEVWVLTQEHNMYDQYGKYFIKVFGDKPTPTELLAEGVRKDEVSWVLAGGGRQGKEDEWWHLDKYRIEVPELRKRGDE